MSELRRRVLGDASNASSSRELTPEPHEDTQLVSVQRLRDLKDKTKKPSRRRTGGAPCHGPRPLPVCG